MRRRKRSAVGCVVALALLPVLAGCGIQLPAPAIGGPSGAAGSPRSSAAGSPRPSPAGSARPSPRDNEVPTPPARAEHAHGAATPTAAVRAFAQAYINWTAADVAQRLRALARRSVGQARTELQLEASETRADRELHRGGIANTGVVEAVAPLRGGDGTQYVVVTQERTTASADAQYEGLAPAWHVSVASVRSVDKGRLWVVSGWQPES